MCILLQLRKSKHIIKTGRIKPKLMIRILRGRESDFFQKIHLLKKSTCSTGSSPAATSVYRESECLLPCLASGCLTPNPSPPPKRTDRAGPGAPVAGVSLGWRSWRSQGYLLGTDSRASLNLLRFRSSWITLSRGRGHGFHVYRDKASSPYQTFTQSTEDVF